MKKGRGADNPGKVSQPHRYEYDGSFLNVSIPRGEPCQV